ncbi:OprD family outer membrane porin [Acidithiobacillus sp. IBUN Pt1247-S3]|uniref:OprD family outer membrane porin n=1 Tax=Acidithiobacillus sp. IBUN Pt1247-S3 TaxID=3166642 RepID=UPI0034E4D97F
MKKSALSVIVLAALASLPAVAQAESLEQYFLAGKVSGDIRSYYFNQFFAGSSVPNRYAYSLGGMIKAQTAPLAGVSAAVAFYTANALGANDLIAPDYVRLDPLLMGPKESLNVLGQAYLQYQDRWAKLQVGNILLNTPWMNGADAFMIPNTYQGVSITVHPLPYVSLMGIRQFRYKNRIQSDYHRETLLNENPDYSYLPDNSNGTLAFGAQAHYDGVSANAWFYRFYDLANLLYATAGYKTPVLLGHFQPFADFQYAREWADGNALAGPINANVYGGMLGLKARYAGVHGQIFAAYDHITQRRITLPTGKVLDNGGFISPYSQQYSADPLYTSIMDYGLISSASGGHAWKFGLVVFPIHNLRIKYSYSLYHTGPFLPNVAANYIDVTYTPGCFWKGLSLRNRLAIDHSNPFADYKGTFIDDRLMLQYSF